MFFFLLRIPIPFHVHLKLIVQTFMVVHCGNILIENCWNHSILTRENVSEEFWKIPYTSHNVIPYIHNTLACNVILDKRCIKFLWTLFNSGYDIV